MKFSFLTKLRKDGKITVPYIERHALNLETGKPIKVTIETIEEK